MKLVVEIELGNDAMRTGADVIDRLPKAIYESLTSGVTEPLEVGDGAAIRDVNGNTVGSWEVTE